MSTTIDRDHELNSAELTDEFHELEAHEAALGRRTHSLELAGPLALLFSVVALGVGIGAMVVALNSDSTSVPTPPAASAGASMPGAMSGGSPSTMMGAGSHGRFSSAQVASAKHGTVYVQLGDFWVAPTVPSVRAGKVTFIARNVGRVPHELMVERMPMKFDAPMQPDENAAQGMIADMEPGAGGRMTRRLSPGTYMLFCNVSGHYASGQHITFNVTKA